MRSGGKHSITCSRTGKRGDYLALYEFEKAQVAEMLEQAVGFVGEIKKLLSEKQ